MPADVINHHCSVVSVAGAGVLIEGPSGSGKTSLALGLVDTARARGLPGGLVCDDQALLERRDGQVIASAPPAIAGLAELRHYGVTRVEPAGPCAITLIGRIGGDEMLARMPETCHASLLGVDLPLVRLPRRHEQQAVRIVLAWLADHGPATMERA